MTSVLRKNKLKIEDLCELGMELEDLEALEARIDRLLEAHARVCEEKAEVERKLKEREEEFHHLRGEILRYRREREEIRQRLDRILGHFQKLRVS